MVNAWIAVIESRSETGGHSMPGSEAALDAGAVPENVLLCFPIMAGEGFKVFCKYMCSSIKMQIKSRQFAHIRHKPEQTITTSHRAPTDYIYIMWPTSRPATSLSNIIMVFSPYLRRVPDLARMISLRWSAVAQPLCSISRDAHTNGPTPLASLSRTGSDM